MWIEPNTTIRICKNVPLDPTYDHTIWFGSESAQLDYFISKSKYLLSQQSYQRVQRGYMRIAKKAEDLYDCNYLMFQNTSFGNKWFYAFIKGVEYINNEVSQINFEIDVMQTWYFNYTLDDCFVEREHTESDELFEHILPENLECGEDVFIKWSSQIDLSNTNLIAIYNSAQSGEAGNNTTIVNNVLMPLEYLSSLSVTKDNLPSIRGFITAITGEGQEDRIVNMYQFPTDLIQHNSSGELVAGQIEREYAVSLDTINGYRPRNNKLFCYPYNFMTVSNNQGDVATFKYENFNNVRNNRVTFRVNGVPVTTPQIAIYPVGYRGATVDYDSGISIGNFPQVAFAGDTFSRWFAQNKNANAASVLTAGIAGIAGTSMAFANPALGAASAGVQWGVRAAGVASVINFLGQVGGIIGKSEDLKNTPPQVHGQINSESLALATGRFGFTVKAVCIKADYARVIDEYFSRFGYACRRTKKPNVHVRQNWTYTKTVGCTISGSIPADDVSKICDIYNNGITFWTDGNNVGNYSLTNNTL